MCIMKDKTTERTIKMLPIAVVKIVEIAAGYVVGTLASDALNKGTKVIKKVVESKKAES